MRINYSFSTLWSSNLIIATQDSESLEKKMRRTRRSECCLVTILIVPFNEGGLIVCVGEISEGDAKFLYAMELVPPEDLGFQESKVSKVPETLNASSLQFLIVRRCLRSEWYRLKRRRTSLFVFTRTDDALYKHIRGRTIFLELCIKLACIYS